MEYHVDEDRFFGGRSLDTGIFVRAVHEGSFGSYDISVLTEDSLLEWLRSHDERHPITGYQWREQVILIILGHSS